MKNSNARAIAVIGVGLRLPGSETMSELWGHLATARNLISEVPKERWDSKRYYGDPRAAPNRTDSKWAGFVKDIDCFDHRFFEISPREAEFMDPQQRLALELAWHAVEDAGFKASDLAGTLVGVFMGASTADYAELIESGVSQVSGHGPTGNSFSIIANRISYFMDFKGPSIALDTACASSLVAIHQASQSLLAGECDYALAGGVNLCWSPKRFVALSQSGMLSKKGLSQAFDADADGYVRGEGGAVVVLKCLDKAEEDGDLIYGVIKGSGVNHGGKTNSLTITNPQAQAELVRSVYQKAGINANAVTYVETHGPGTPFGDPIEIHGLKQAFQQLAAAQGVELNEKTCALGSIKTNLGHLEAAAGVTGLVKVLLCLQNRQLVENLHFKNLNPMIRLKGSPFYVLERSQSWEANGEHKLRCAGVSSFGFGGSNAHLVVEEYAEKRSAHSSAKGPWLIPIYAKSLQRLQEYARRINTYLEQTSAKSKPSLQSLAYSFQSSRETMESGVLVLVHSFEDFKRKLNKIIAGNFEQSEVWLKTLEEKGLSSDKASKRVKNTRVRKCIQNKNWQAVADYWAEGNPIDWTLLYKKNPRKVRIPTYPFERVRHWFPEEKAPVDPRKSDHLHPLLHKNCSSLSRQSFESIFSGDEFFFCDHQVYGERILPGVAYWEMVVVAVKASIEEYAASQHAILLKSIFWREPLPASLAATGVCLNISANRAPVFEFEILTCAGGDKKIHCSGTVELTASTVDSDPVDLQMLRADAALGLKKVKARCYQLFANRGISYGPGHQAIQTLFCTDSFALGHLVLASNLNDTLSEYMLHPGLLDAALQCWIGLDKGSEFANVKETEAVLPFAVEEVNVFASCTAEMWAYVRHSQGPRQGSVLKLDIDLLREDGTPCVSIRGFSARKLSNLESNTTDREAQGFVSLDLVPQWMPLKQGSVSAEIKTAAATKSASPAPVIIGGTVEERKQFSALFPNATFLGFGKSDSIAKISKRLSAVDIFTQIIWLVAANPKRQASSESIIADQQQGLVFGFRLVKALIELGYDSKPLQFVLITQNTMCVTKSDKTDATHAGIHGLFGVAAKELSSWDILQYDLASSEPWPTGTSWLFMNRENENKRVRAYRHGSWHEQVLLRAESSTTTETLYKNGGVYVVIGGAGGLGKVWTEMMVRQFAAKVIWIGRRQMDAEIKQSLREISAFGEQPHYISADATNLTELSRAYQEIKSHYGEINGVLHSALVLDDKTLTRMQENEFLAVLRAKIDISVRIAQTFNSTELDFVLFFSSMTSFIQAKGQANYAAACVFKDAFAAQLGQEWNTQVKTINWGYWGQVGIVASDEYRERMHAQGVGSIGSEEGIAALSRLFHNPISQMGFIKCKQSFAQLLIDEDRQLRVLTASSPGERPQFHAEVSRLKIGKKIATDLASWQDKLDELIAQFLYSILAGIPAIKSSAVLDLSDDKFLDYVRHSALDFRWFKQSFEFLAAAGLLQKSKGRFKFQSRPQSFAKLIEKLANFTEQTLSHYGQEAYGKLVIQACKNLQAILDGQTKATDVLFPKGSLTLVEPTYKDNPVADFYNELLVDFLQQRLTGFAQEQPKYSVRILEVGAGTGGTSKRILSRLKQYDLQFAEYVYTDVSKTFLNHGRENYSPDNPAMSFKLLNIEEPIQAQDFEVGVYDIVVATNVLHATVDIRKTLINLKSLLKKNGCLFLNEMSENRVFHHLTFGLLDGWWLYQDAGKRIPGSPALTAESWQVEIADAGFEVLAQSQEMSAANSQVIVVAQSDGLILEEKLEKESQSNEKVTASTVPQTIQILNPAENFLGDALLVRSLDYFRRLVAKVIKTRPEEISETAALERYGIDSILVIELTNEIRKIIPDVSSTIFFEYKTLNELVGYLVTKYSAVLTDLVSGQADLYNTDRASETNLQQGTYSPKIKLTEASTKVAPATRGNMDIAIIGLSGRYPEAPDVDTFWENLKAGRNSVKEIPADRWNWRNYFSEQKGQWGKVYTKWGGFLDEIDKFDPLFFNISPKEALRIDPQERLYLEESYRCIEDAGYTPETLNESRKVGVFVGVMNSTYTGKPSLWSIANRSSYFFNFQGPSLAIDTACSSSLTAIHLALESLASGTCDCALAGGINLIVNPVQYFELTAISAVSKGRENRSFGAEADGFVDGEGVGVVLLKPLWAAERDGDHIYGVLKGSMINAGGKTNGYTVPNPQAQKQLVQDALSRANISADTISYIEAHGTGTPLGDPIEIAGLSNAFAESTAEKQFCALGSVKSNIGHLESAAGIAGVTKVLLQFKHQQIAPSLHSETLNPEINFANTPFQVQQTLSQWEQKSVNQHGVEKVLPRRAGVSSFGAGGANAHVLLEEYEYQTDMSRRLDNADGRLPIVLSAKTSEQLEQRAKQLLQWLQDNPQQSLLDIAFTLQFGREAMEERLAFAVNSSLELQEKLQQFAAGQNKDIFRGSTESNLQATMPFLFDDDLQNVVSQWVSKGKLGMLLRYWVQGLEVDWTFCYKDKKPRRISLPTYPFAKESYWAPEWSYHTDRGGAIEPSSNQREPRFLKRSWYPKPVQQTSKVIDADVIIFCSQTTLAIAEILSTYFGSGCRLINFSTEVIDERYKNIEWQKYSGCIQLVGNDELEPDFEKIHCLQNLLQENRGKQLRLLYVTSGLELIKNTRQTMAGAALVGFYRMLQSEYSQVDSSHMDCDPEWGDDVFAKTVVAEYHTPAEAPAVCYRGFERYALFLDVLDFPTQSEPKITFPQDKLLLVTGGTRGLGRLCAQHMVKEYGVKKLLLLGREELPPKTQWARLATGNDATAEKIRGLQALEQLGARVEVASTPLSDQQALQELISRATTSMGEIAGVLHCAGLAMNNNPAFIRKNRNDFETVFAPKVQGLNNLFTAVGSAPLQFFVVFSSVSSLLPSLAVGSSDYATANTYMDYWAEVHSQAAPTLSIQWPSWKESGMPEITSEAYRITGLLSHTDKEGLDLFDKVLKLNSGSVVMPAIVNPNLWDTTKLLHSKLDIKVSDDNAGKKRKTLVNRVPSENVSSTNDASLAENTLAWVIDVFTRELQIARDKFKANKSFQDYGVDSILLAQLVTVMSRELQEDSLDPTIFLENPNAKLLSEYLATHYQKKLALLFAESTPKASESSEPQRLERDKNNAQTYVSEITTVKQPLEPKSEKIAIVGMACHFPDANNIDEYWQNLSTGKDSIREVPATRWDSRKYYGAARNGEQTSTSKWGAFLDSIEDFDPDFFNIPEALAPQIDPLVRQWLEVSVEALADAGLPSEMLSGRQVGVFAGSRVGNFINKIKNPHKDVIVGIGQNFITAHLAHLYNLKGPNMVVDTACSSSISALHLAVQSLQRGESEFAIAGGVDILLDETVYLTLSTAQVLSEDGRCKTFDSSANGIGLGEGCGVVIMQPLSKAIQEGRKIYGVIDGSAINNDGATMGITTPNPDAQYELISAAVNNAGVPVDSISYVEAHGTGTLIGDPIELNGLTRVFRDHTLAKQFCAVGSVKANIGHLLSAAGIAGVIKTLLCISHRQLVPSLHCDNPNPRFKFEESPLYLSQKLEPWMPAAETRRAGISAFGLGGNNAHIIISDAGIPEELRATTKPLGERIIFNRRRFWPEEASTDSAVEDVASAQEKENFMSYFDEEVTNL